ncbi:MAG: hypothetical protein JNN03_23545 [Rubrivivax sp.]|nr:hypothetical protein [Rubrivivax sp.]
MNGPALRGGLHRPAFGSIARRFVASAALAGVALLATSGSSAAELADRIGLHEGEGGTTCASYLEGALAWQRSGGDWRDAKGRLHGEQAWASASPSATGAAWDATALVTRWQAEGRRVVGVLLRVQGGGDTMHFHSREAAPADRPMLALEFSDGSREELVPSADTHLDCSTVRALGRSPTLMVSERVASALQFSLPADKPGRQLRRARLLLTVARSHGRASIGLFELAVPGLPGGAALSGLAAAYPGDRGIERDPQVMYAAGFDDGAWQPRFAKGGFGEVKVVADDSARGFRPLVGQALRINLKKGSNYGADLRVNLKDFGGEPDEVYLRYYLRLARDWNPTVDGGKFPGLAGTYNRAGWGGRRSDGSNGWSARGAFARAFPADHPLQGLTQLQTYAYHADMPTDYGELWPWPGALLERERWYCVEQHVKLNRPGAADGELRVWIDGRPSLHRKALRFRRTEALHIEAAWLGIYHGGTATSPHDQHLYIDNVVVARRYIGPMPGAGARAGEGTGR